MEESISSIVTRLVALSEHPVAMPLEVRPIDAVIAARYMTELAFDRVDRDADRSTTRALAMLGVAAESLDGAAAILAAQ